MENKIKLDHQLDLTNQTILIETISRVVDANITNLSSPQTHEDNSAFIEQLHNRITYLRGYNEYLQSQADSIEKNLNLLRITIPQQLKHQTEQIQQSVKIEVKRRDELKTIIPRLEAEFQILNSKIKCLDQQIEASCSLNQELRIKNTQLKTESNALDLPNEEIIPMRELNLRDNEINEHEHLLDFIRSASGSRAHNDQ